MFTTLGGIKIEGPLTLNLWRDIASQIEEYGEDLNKISPERFNDGFCDIYSDVIGAKSSFIQVCDEDFIRELKEKESFYTLCPHSFVQNKKNGKFYDIETPLGVEDFLDLPIFKRWINKSLF